MSLDPLNITSVAQAQFVTEERRLTREGYYFLLDIVNFVGRTTLSHSDVQVLQVFDNDSTSLFQSFRLLIDDLQSEVVSSDMSALTARLQANVEDVQRQLATLSDSGAQVATLQAKLDEMQAQIAMLPDVVAQAGVLASLLEDVRRLLEVVPSTGTSTPPQNTLQVLEILSGAGAPTNGVTGAGYATPGIVDYLDTTNSDRYINAGTLASPTWKLWGRSA